MNGLVIVLFAAALVCSSASGGSYGLPYAYGRPYGALRNFIPPVAPVAPLTSMIPAASAPLTSAALQSILENYYAYASSLGTPYSPYNYLYSGAYSAYPTYPTYPTYLKK